MELEKPDSFLIQLFTFTGICSYFVLRGQRSRVEAEVNKNDRVIISDAAWAWEGLRRNRAYRKAWSRYGRARPRICDARASVRYVRLERPYLEAETFGLICFADPDLSASEVPVLWRPSLLRRTLQVSLSVKPKADKSGFSLASLKCCPTVLDTADGERHIRLGGHHFWIQMVTQDITQLDDDTSIEVKLTGSNNLLQRISTVEQLFSLHRSADGIPAVAKRPPNRDKLLEGLLAWDIYYGMNEGSGTLKDVAIALFGEARIAHEWGHNRSLKDRAIRARDRGRAFVQGGYFELLKRTSF